MSSTVDARFAVPGLPPHHVSRPRLMTLLDEAVASASVTVLAAGAGAGKSVLLTDWALERAEPVAWLGLTPEDDDPARFWRLFVDAVRALGRAVPPVAWWPGGTTELLDAVLGDEVASGPSPGLPLVLVLDDAHVLTDPQIVSGVDQVVRRWSGQVRLVMAGRAQLGLPLHRYRLAGELREIGIDDLAMTEPEAADLLAAHRVEISGAEVGALVARTEGWAAGLRLAALWLENGDRRAASLALAATGTGSVAEYLTEEVLAVLPQDVQRVLAETSFLDVVPGPLADAVTMSNGCGELLEQQAANSMVIPVPAVGPGDGTAAGFRYHHLLREVLRHRDESSPVSGRRARRLRAADWYRERGDLSRALQCTLDAGDDDQVRVLVLRGGLIDAFVAQYELTVPAKSAIMAAATSTAERGTQRRQPSDRIGLEDAEDAVMPWAFAALTADRDRAADVVTSLPVPDLSGADTQLRVTQHVAELLLARTAGATDVLDRAVQALHAAAPPPGVLGAALMVQARSRFGDGRLGEVLPLLDRAADEAAGAPPVLVDVLATRAFVAMTAGLWSTGIESIRRAETVLDERPGLARPLTLDLAIARRAELAADWGSMGTSFGRVLAAGPFYADRGVASTVALLHGTYLACSGRLVEAREHLRTTPMLRQEGIGPLVLLRDRELAEVEIQLGRPQAALDLLEPHDPSPLSVVAAATVARALVALGDLEGARRRLRQITPGSGPPVDRRVRVEALLADALVSLAAGQEEGARELVGGALDLAGDEIMAPFVRWRADFSAFLARQPQAAGRWPIAVPPRMAGALAVPSQTREPAAGPQPDHLRERAPVDLVAELARLAHLRDAGAVSEAEFTARKAELLYRA